MLDTSKLNNNESVLLDMLDISKLYFAKKRLIRSKRVKKSLKCPFCENLYLFHNSENIFYFFNIKVKSIIFISKSCFINFEKC